VEGEKKVKVGERMERVVRDMGGRVE